MYWSNAQNFQTHLHYIETSAKHQPRHQRRPQPTNSEKYLAIQTTTLWLSVLLGRRGRPLFDGVCGGGRRLGHIGVDWLRAGHHAAEAHRGDRKGGPESIGGN